MSLSEVIAGLKHGETVVFGRVENDIQFIASKTDDQLERKQIARRVDAEELKQCSIDILAVEVRRAFDILRRSEATSGD
jgi:hypothetical protein